MNTEILEFLSSGLDEKSCDYELCLTNFVVDHNTSELELELLDVVENSTDLQVAYNAFYCLNIYYRRSKDYYKLAALYDKYTKVFSKHITFDHILVIYQIESGSLYDYDDVLTKTYKDSKMFENNPGFQHLFASVFVTIFENGNIHDEQAYIDEWYQLALQAADNAIEINNEYAKYYCTKARLLSINHNYSEAISYVNKAISIERSDRHDYTLRISDYQYHKMMINVNKKIYEFQSKLNNGQMAYFIGDNDNRKMSSQDEFDTDFISVFDDKKPYAFISYSHENEEESYELIRLLHKHGINIWFDKGIEVGSEYASSIAEKLYNADAFVIIITPESINSEFVRKELQMALDLNMKPVCIYLKETMLTPGMMIQLNIYEHIYKYKMSETTFISKVIPAIKNQMSIHNIERK